MLSSYSSAKAVAAALSLAAATPSFTAEVLSSEHLDSTFVQNEHLSLPAPADLVLVNGNIYPLNNTTNVAEALAVRNERIVFVGSKLDTQSYIREGTTQVIDLLGKTVLPGFTDAHTHPLTGGLQSLVCNLYDQRDTESALAALSDFARTNSSRPWIHAENLYITALPKHMTPLRAIDEVVADRPVFISLLGEHAALVNSRALDLAGITDETVDPPGGKIERDPVTKKPTGLLFESALGLVQNLLPPFTQTERLDALQKGIAEASAVGVTSLVDAQCTAADLETYFDLARTRGLNAHLNLSIYVDLSKGSNSWQRALELNERYRPQDLAIEDIQLNQAKLYVDGVVSERTAALFENYCGHDDSGALIAPAGTIHTAIAALDRAGMQIHVHAWGDKGIRTALDGFERARQLNGVRDARHHIAHLHVIHPDDLPRFRALDITGNFQALWASIDDPYVAELNNPLLGPQRAEWQYPIGAFVQAGGRTVYSSDWPVDSMNPLRAAQVAVTRREPDGTQREPWTPQHLVDLMTVVTGYTRTGAWLTFRERDTGTLEPGKYADLVILDQDLFKVSKFQIAATAVERTMFRGRFVHTNLAQIKLP